MANGPFSSLSRRERFQAYLTVMLVIAALMVFAVIAVITIHDKSLTSKAGAARLDSGGPTPALGGENTLNPPIIWNAGTNGGGTNAASPLSASAAPADNMN